MYTKNDKLYYTWEDYNEDLNAICNVIEVDCISSNSSVVAIYRGSLGIGAHISNVMNMPLSILRYQTRDGQDDVPKMVIDNIKNGKPIVVVDDICDTGKTMDDITSFLRDNYPNSYLLRITIFGNGTKSLYIREHTGEWVVFPWERLDEITKVK